MFSKKRILDSPQQSDNSEQDHKNIRIYSSRNILVFRFIKILNQGVKKVRKFTLIYQQCFIIFTKVQHCSKIRKSILNFQSELNNLAPKFRVLQLLDRVVYYELIQIHPFLHKLLDYSSKYFEIIEGFFTFLLKCQNTSTTQKKLLQFQLFNKLFEFSLQIGVNLYYLMRLYQQKSKQQKFKKNQQQLFIHFFIIQVQEIVRINQFNKVYKQYYLKICLIRLYLKSTLFNINQFNNRQF
ncbi:unnamed protein product [Paramecium pentaurelia]|uniref:Uncharacterized protein n=1 Tax=Paramecium pentaurelia TaxID=43138 RepID=A0A8S1WJQ8_9CILI|nr:unnamed protein product [Paramecium pentaurelia]